MLNRHGEFDPKQYKIVLDDMPQLYKPETKREYQTIRREWFWKAVNAVDQYPEYCVQTLDKALEGNTQKV